MGSMETMMGLPVRICLLEGAEVEVEVGVAARLNQLRRLNLQS
jgi:hypothetical protein